MAATDPKDPRSTATAKWLDDLRLTQKELSELVVRYLDEHVPSGKSRNIPTSPPTINRVLNSDRTLSEQECTIWERAVDAYHDSKPERGRLHEIWGHQTPVIEDGRGETGDRTSSRVPRFAIAAVVAGLPLLGLGALIFLGNENGNGEVVCVVDLRNRNPIPEQTECSDGATLTATGDLDHRNDPDWGGWNGTLSSWQVDGTDVDAHWEDWGIGEAIVAEGTVRWVTDGQHEQGDPQNDKYQQLDIKPDYDGATVTIWEHNINRGRNVTFTYSS